MRILAIEAPKPGPVYRFQCYLIASMSGATSGNVVCLLSSSDLYADGTLRRFEKYVTLSEETKEVRLQTRYYMAQASVVVCNLPERLPRCDALVLLAPVSHLSVAKALWEKCSRSADADATRLLILDTNPDSSERMGELLAWSCRNSIEVLCPEVCEHGVGQRVLEALECTKWTSMISKHPVSARSYEAI